LPARYRTLGTTSVNSGGPAQPGPTFARVPGTVRIGPEGGPMQDRTAGRIAVSLFGLDLAITAFGLVLVVLTRDTDLGPGPSSVESDAVLLLSFTPFAAVGALIISRRPRNSIGWIFMITALGMALSTVAFDYAVYALLTNPGSLPGGEVAIRVSEWGFALPFL